MTDYKHAELDNVEKLDEALRGDVDHWLSRIDAGDKSQLVRRSLVRALFAMIEGLVFSLKRIVLQFSAEGDGPLTADEIALLSEKTQELSKDGEVLPKTALLKFKPNLQFAFRKFSEISKAGYALDVSVDGWEKLGRSLKIRDRLMHPKSAEDILVTDDELPVVRKACEWFAGAYSDLWNHALAAYSRENAEAKKRLEDSEAKLRALQEQLEKQKGGA